VSDPCAREVLAFKAVVEQRTRELAGLEVALENARLLLADAEARAGAERERAGLAERRLGCGRQCPWILHRRTDDDAEVYTTCGCRWCGPESPRTPRVQARRLSTVGHGLDDGHGSLGAGAGV
jgi:hypothetical protein